MEYINPIDPTQQHQQKQKVETKAERNMCQLNFEGLWDLMTSLAYICKEKILYLYIHKARKKEIIIGEA